MIPQISTLQLRQLASGDYLFLKVYKFIGKTQGKKTYIQANLHGAEIVGNYIIQKLIEFLGNLEADQIRGEIWLIPVCNPLATNTRTYEYSTGRFNFYDGQDWNRIFFDDEPDAQTLLSFATSHLESTEGSIVQEYREILLNKLRKHFQRQDSSYSLKWVEKYAYYLQSLSLDADYVIDLHCDTDRTLEYLFGFEGRRESAKSFGMEHCVVFDQYINGTFVTAFIKPWLSLEKTLAELDREIQFDIEAWTLEMKSGEVVDESLVERGFQAIKDYLLNKDVLLTSKATLPTRSVNYYQLKDYKDYWSPWGGMVYFKVQLGDRINKKDLLYQVVVFDKKQEFPVMKNIYAEQAGIVCRLSSNQSMNEGELVMSIFET